MSHDLSFTHQGQFDDFSWISEGSAYRDDEFYVEARIKNDVLSEIHLGGPFNLSISEVLANIGQPNLITSGLSNYGETLYLEAQVELHYPQYGNSFALFYWGEPTTENGFTPCFSPDDVIYRIQIYPATSREHYISESRNISEDRVDVIDEWPGYECIEVQW